MKRWFWGAVASIAASCALALAPAAASAEAGHCKPITGVPGSDIISELFPQGYSFADGGRTNFVENEYELATPLCQANLPTDPATGLLEPPGGQIVIHVYWHTMCATASTCPLKQPQVDGQIIQLNRDFAGTDISFALAGSDFDVAPQFADSPGLFPLSPLELAMKRQYHEGTYADLNVYATQIPFSVFQATQGLLGWSTMPVPHPDPLARTLDGVVEDTTYVGAGQKDLAREAGYWLSLYNPWHNGLNAPGDYVDDTPPMPAPIYGCQNPPYVQQLPPGERPTVLNNMMGFTPDTCIQRFTPGQAVRMWAADVAMRQAPARP